VGLRTVVEKALEKDPADRYQATRGSSSRSGETATKISSAPISAPAASGCRICSDAVDRFRLVGHGTSCKGQARRPGARKTQTPNRDRRRAANVITKPYAAPDPRLTTGFR
jgi:hypothetical protein